MAEELVETLPVTDEEQGPGPKYKVTKQVLADFSATVTAKPNLTMDELLQKFPEFNNDGNMLQSALDYSATLQTGKYKTTEELDSKFPEFEIQGEKKNETAPAASTDGLGHTTPDAVEVVPFSAVTLAKQANELQGKKKEILSPVTSNPLAIGTASSTFVTDDEAVNQAAKIKADLKAKGYDADKLYQQYKDVPDGIANMPGYRPEDEAINPQNHERKLATASWQTKLASQLKTKLADGSIDATKVAQINSAIEGAQSGTHTYPYRREDTRNIINFINENVPDPDEKQRMLDHVKVDRAFSYGQEGAIDKDKALADDPRKQFLNDNQLLGLQFIEDTEPGAAGGYESILIDPKKYEGNALATAGAEEKKRKLEITGLSLKQNAVQEDINNLSNIKEEDLTPAMLDRLTKLTEESSLLQKQQKEISEKYPTQQGYSIQEFTQELIGSPVNKPMWLAGKVGQSFENSWNGVIELVSGAVNSEESSKLMQLEASGDKQRENSLFQVNQADAVLKNFTTSVSPSLQAQIDPIIKNDQLSWEEKYQKLYPLLKANPGEWGKIPTKGSQVNLSPSSLFYSVGGMAATIAPYLVIETATGGGATAGIGRKILSSFNAAAATSFHDAYSSSVLEGVADPYAHALRTTAINSAAMAGAGTPELIRGLYSSKTAIGEILAKMSDTEINQVLKAGSKSIELFKKTFKVAGIYDAGKSVIAKTAESLKGGAKFEGIMAGAKVINSKLDNKQANPEELFKEAVVGTLNFGLFGAISGSHSQYKKLNNLNYSSAVRSGLQPKVYTEQANKMLSEGHLTSEEHTNIVENIKLASQVVKATKFIDNDGKALNEKATGLLLLSKMKEYKIKNEASGDVPPAFKEKKNTELEKLKLEQENIYSGKVAEPEPAPEKPIGQKFREDLTTNFAAKRAEYKAKFGNIINADNAKTLSEDYKANPAKNITEIHPPSSEFATKLYNTELKEEPKAGKVLLTSGGTGAGKSTAVNGSLNTTKYDVVFDTNLIDPKDSIKKIENALNSGRKVDIAYVYRDPIVAFEKGVIPRMQGPEGRPVNIDFHVASHEKALSTIEKLQEYFKDNPKVKIIVVDNSGEMGKQSISSLENVRGKSYLSEELKAKLHDISGRQHREGSITDEQHTALTRSSPDDGAIQKPDRRGEDKPDRSGDGGRTEQPGEPRQVDIALPEGVHYQDSKGNQVVIKDGLKTVINKAGKEVSAPTKRKILAEHLEKINFTEGERSPEPTEPISSDAEYFEHVIKTSKNPAELVEVYDKNLSTDSISTVESAIAEHGIGKIKRSGFTRFEDKNNINQSLAKSYFSDSGESIDTIAVSKERPNNIARDAAARFEELTGLKFNDKHAEIVRVQAKEVRLEAQEMAIKENEYADAELNTTDAKEIVKNEGLTLENLEANKHLFEGFPFTPEDFENVKNELNEAGRSTEIPEGVEPETTRITDDKKTGTESQEKEADSPIPGHDGGSSETGETSGVIGEALRDFADFVEKGKISKLGGFKSSTAFDLVWDGALSIIARSLREGANLSDAIEFGLSHIKRTEWYRKLSDKKAFEEKFTDHVKKEIDKASKNFSKWKNFGVKEFKKEGGKLDFPTFKDRFLKEFKASDETDNISINEIYGEAQKAYNKVATPTRAKANIENTTGIKPYEKTVTMTERSALINQIRFAAKAAKSIENVRKNFAATIKAHLDLSVKSGTISVKQSALLARRAAEVGVNAEKLNDFMDYSEKVIEDANYQDKVNQGKDARSNIKKAISNKSIQKAANNVNAVKAFLRIDPVKVENIDEYNSVAEKVLINSKGVSVNIKGGKGTISNESYAINNEAIDRYVNDQAAYGEMMAKEKLARTYEDLVDAGVIDPANMSLSDMKEIIEAVNNEDPINGEEYLLKIAKDKEKLTALRSMIDYQKIGLEEWYKNQAYMNRSAEQLEVVRNLALINNDNLDIKQLAKLNDVINNIVVNDSFTDAGNISILAKVQKDNAEILQKEKIIGVKLGSIKNSVLNGLSSINLMTEFITKSTKLAAEVQRLTGISGIFNGHAQAKQTQDRTISEYTDLKKALGKDIDNAENRYRRGIYARMIQHFGGDAKAVDAEFKRAKGLIKQTAEKLKSSSVATEIKEGEVLQKVYDELLEHAGNADDVKATMIAVNKNNIPIVDFWIKKFSDTSERTAENAEIFDNKSFENIVNYSSTKMKGVNGEFGVGIKDTKDVFDQIYFSKKVDNKVAGTKSSRTRSPVLPEKSVLDLDFDTVQSQRFYETNYDVNTKKAIAQARMFFESPESVNILGSIDNRRIMQDAVKKSVLMQKGSVTPVEAWEKSITKAVNAFQAKGARIALGSFSQVIKQYPSVAFNTLLNLGTDMGLYVKALTISNNIPIFSKYNIGLRGETKAGFNKELDFSYIDRTNFGNGISQTTAAISSATTKITDGVMSALVRSDVSVARTSWLSFYMQDLKRQGVDLNTIDWKNEHTKSNDEAAAYAEQMVSRNQNPNDASSMAAIYKDSKGVKGILKNMVMPFSSFSSNQRMRMTNDMQKILFGGEKIEAIKSLAATGAEQALFNALKVYVIGGATTAGARGIAALLGFWDDEDKKSAEDREKDIKITVAGHTATVSQKFKKVAANTISDFFFSGMGTMPQNNMNKALSKAYSLAATEEYANGNKNYFPSLFYQYQSKPGETDYTPYGMAGILPKRLEDLQEIGKVAITGKYDRVVKGGSEANKKTEKVDITPEERKAFILSFAVDALGIAGLSDADALMMNKKLQTIMQQKMKERYGGKSTLTIYQKPKL